MLLSSGEGLEWFVLRFQSDGTVLLSDLMSCYFSLLFFLCSDTFILSVSTKSEKQIAKYK